MPPTLNHELDKASPLATFPAIPDWGKGPPIPNRGSKRGAEEKFLGRSGVSERGSATTFHSVSDMGHKDWIKSLGKGGRTPEEVSEELSKPMKVELSSMRSRLTKACVKPAIHHHKEQFLPLGQLLRILSPKNVDELLRQKFPEDVRTKFAHQVYDDNGNPKRLKIMGTLLLMEHLEFLWDFFQANVEDKQLPLALDEEEDGGVILHDRHGNKIESPHKWSWKYGQAEFFMYKQMQVCSLFCTLKETGGYMDHFRLPGNFILPFLGCDPPVVSFGGFGKVTKVKIEPSHLWYRGTSRKPSYFSVKTIRHYLQDHPNEADALARRVAIPNTIDREHLHRLLFSFRRAEFYYLVFEWADGDLTKLWQKMPELYKPNDPKGVSWFLKQCVGIMRSLKSLHKHASSFSPGEGLEQIRFEKCHGRHSDIKPENILWFENYQDDKKDHLVIADLGLTQFKATQSKSRVAWADVGGYTQTYKAPESEVKGLVGGKYDIWSLGCVFLEHASVFLKGDAECVKRFSKNRLEEEPEHQWYQDYASNVFYNLVSDGGHGDAGSKTAKSAPFRAEVKNTVKQWIKDLQAHKLCSDAMSKFLDLIDKGMLVPDASQRKNAEETLDQLIKIQKGYERASQSQDLAGISGGQESPRAIIKVSGGETQEITTIDEIDLLPLAEPISSFSAFRCLDTPPASIFSETLRTRSSGSSVPSLQQTSSIDKLIESFELLTINKRCGR